jgi:hypothetical protein
MRARLMLLASAVLAGLAIFGSTGASAQGVPLFAVLNGVNECNGAAAPNPLTCRVGDVDGFGSAMVIFPTTTTICYSIIVHNLATIGTNQAHIHTGAAGVNGPILVNLSPPSPLTGNPNGWGSCKAVTAQTSAAIKANPSGYYVNVHSNEKPAGAIRGQLF